MSTFPGIVQELPNISIDRFDGENLNSTCFFLSHCHQDHMVGLRNNSFIEILLTDGIYLYCSEISRAILLGEEWFLSVKHKIIAVSRHKDINVPSRNDSLEYRLNVSIVPAGHCPGSVMFLFQTHIGTILYTGDFRIGLGDVKKLKYLDDLGYPKKIDKIYFDSTFFNESYHTFPARTDTVIELSKLMDDWRGKSSSHVVLLNTPAKYGYEFLFIELSQYFKCRIHVHEIIYNTFKHVPEIGSYLTLDLDSTFIHSCWFPQKQRAQKCGIWTDVDKRNILTIKTSAAWYKDDKPVVKAHGSNRVQACFATHCSYSELLEFLNYFKPRNLYPCTSVYSMTDSEVNINMERDAKLEELLSSWRDSEEISLDKREESELAYPSQPVTIKIPVFHASSRNNLLDSPPARKFKKCV